MSNIGKTVLITERKTCALELRHFISKIIFPAYPELYLKFYIFYNPLHKPHKLYFQMIPTKQKRYFIMTLDSYRNFVTIVDCGSIVAAANKLLIAQPSLSNQLKNIEKTYGAKLLLRGNRSLELTDAGRIFYKRAKEICMMEEGLRNELLNQKAGFSELLKISIPAGNSPYFLHKFFDDFIAKHPKVNYDFYEIPSEFVIPNVLNGITEIGLIRSAAPGHGALTLYPYEREDIVALFPKDHPLAKIKGKLSVPDLANYPLAIPFDCLDIVYASFGHYLLSPNVSMITSPKTTAIEWARSFGSVALVSLTKEDIREIKDMCIKYISDENLYIMSAFIISKDRHLSKIAKEFLQVHGIEVS
jgi:DNA-binding transcriptional LysR family regulator